MLGKGHIDMSKKTHQGIADEHGFVRTRERDIERQVDRDVFSHGTHLFRTGAILDPVLGGDIIRAMCEDGSLYPHQVQLTLTRPGDRGHNPSSHQCTCADEGLCAHAVALLLTWIDDPGRFMKVQTSEEMLDGKSREELVDIIERMLSAQPYLIRLLDASTMNLPGPTAGLRIKPVELAQRVRMHLEPFRQFRPVRGAAPPSGHELQEIVSFAYDLGLDDKWSTVKTILQVLALEIMDVLEDYRGTDPTLYLLLATVEGGLAEAFQMQGSTPIGDRLSPHDRRETIQTLYQVWRFVAISAPDARMGAYGIGSILGTMTIDEREEVEQWLDDDTEVREWGGNASISLRARFLEATPRREDEVLDLFRKSGWWEEYATVLVDRDRVDEAVAVAEQHLMGADFTNAILDEVVDYSRPSGESALPLYRGFPWTGPPESKFREATIEYWILSKYLELNKPAQSLDYAQRYFRRRPNLARWEAVRSIANQPGMQPGTWDNLRADLVNIMREEERLMDLIDVHIEEGDIRAALDTHASVDRDSIPYLRGWGYHATPDRSDFLQQERNLAFAAAGEFPDEAIAIYFMQAEEFIGERKRESYREAAAVLTHAKAVDYLHGRKSDWDARMADIRARYPKLRALKDELDALDL